MNAGERNRDDLLAELLVKVDEQLADGTASDSVDTSSIADSDELPADWQRGLRCLEMLHRVRREWSPDEDITDTPPEPDGSSTELPHDPAGTELGRFHILRELGHGGLGIVYLAHDPKLHRLVALKVPRLKALASQDLRSRFLREAEAAARLNHPHLVSVYDSGEDGQICFIAAEYCPGPTLAEWLKDRQTAVPIDMAARIVKQLAEAVQHAHGRGVLHRDIKPSNVMMCPADDAPEGTMSSSSIATEGLTPKLTDFGMAKLLESSGDETRTGALVGTPAYMAPEQARGEVREVDARADVYALGAMLYEILTGSRTFPSDSEVGALRRVMFEEPAAPRSLRKEIPRDLETICLKALAKDARERYQTASELAADLSRFLADEPILARRVHPVEKGWRWLKRRPLIAAILVVVLVAAAALESSRRLSREVYALQGFRDVHFATEPAGARLAIVRLNEHTSEPDPSQVLRPSQRTPLTVPLKPGDYLVVAALDDQRFHEVYRRVPPPDQTIASPLPHLRGDPDDTGKVVVPPVKIPEVVETREMVAIECPDLASAKEKLIGKSPGLFVDCDEMTAEHLSRQLAQTSLDEATQAELLNLFHEQHSYDSAVRIAESVGKRLPSESEFECMAAAYEVRKTSSSGPIEQTEQQVSTQPCELRNLFAGKAEWTSSSLPTSNVQETGFGSPELRIVRGVASGTSLGATDSDPRHGRLLIGRVQSEPDVGFRCVRSKSPRFLDD